MLRRVRHVLPGVVLLAAEELLLLGGEKNLMEGDGSTKRLPVKCLAELHCCGA